MNSKVENRMNGFELSSCDDYLLICGGQNAKKQDRTLDRKEIKSVQLFHKGEIRNIPFFDTWGELGISSMAFDPKNPLIMFFCNGLSLYRLDMLTMEVAKMSINLIDVHEMTIIDESLWIANTGDDEAVEFDVHRSCEVKRIKLDKFRKGQLVESGVDKQQGEAIDRFHFNQVFKGYDGNMYALVHHASGQQLVNRIAEKLIKKHGNGGVVNLTTGEAIQLNLKAPHSVRMVDGDYWVFDSGATMARVYDEAWQLKASIPTKGWGRGAAISLSSGYFYAGISSTRKRYWSVTGSPNLTSCYVEVFNTESHDKVGELEIRNVEQISNLYTISAEQAQALLKG